MKLQTAEILTYEITRILSPFCRRIEIAGSVRRKCPEVNDIDLVVIQDSYKLAQYLQSKESSSNEINSRSIDLKIGPKHRQVRYQGNKIELWFASEDNFGLIYLIRTGSAFFSQSILAKWKQVSNGGYSKGGYLHTSDHKKFPTYEETGVFKLCGINYIDPLNRSFKNFIPL